MRIIRLNEQIFLQCYLWVGAMLKSTRFQDRIGFGFNPNGKRREWELKKIQTGLVVGR